MSLFQFPHVLCDRAVVTWTLQTLSTLSCGIPAKRANRQSNLYLDDLREKSTGNMKETMIQHDSDSTMKFPGCLQMSLKANETS